MPNTFEDKADGLEAETAEQGFCKVELPAVPSEPCEVVDLVTESDSSESESGDSCIASEDSFVFQPLAKRSRC